MKFEILRSTLLTSCFLLFFYPILLGQNNQINLEKYWHYRYRLVNYFMVVGEGQGMSLPAYVRNRWGNRQIDWGETPRYLGWYIGVLATEYRLLANTGGVPNQTKMELYYALKALERLDKSAEPVYNPGSPEKLDGFILREDIYEDFVNINLLKLNKDLDLNAVYPNSQNWTVGSGDPAPVDFTTLEVVGRKTASQDMIEELMLGISLVKKCVDDVTLSFQDINGNVINDNLHKRAIDEADRILTYIRNVDKKKQHQWTIYDPDGEYVGNGDGGDLGPFAHG